MKKPKRKKPEPKFKLSEIRLLQAQAIHTDEDFTQLLHTDIPHLLKLVERLGKALLRFADGPFCNYCSIMFENDGSITHEDKCPVPQARALLLEIKE